MKTKRGILKVSIAILESFLKLNPKKNKIYGIFIDEIYPTILQIKIEGDGCPDVEEACKIPEVMWIHSKRNKFSNIEPIEKKRR